MPDQLVAAAAAVDRATEIVDTATRTLAHASSDGGRISVDKLDTQLAVDIHTLTTGNDARASRR